MGSHPQDWCPKCKAIAAGKAERCEDGLLDVPAKKKAPAKKPAAKKTTSAARKTAKAATTEKVAA